MRGDSLMIYIQLLLGLLHPALVAQMVKNLLVMQETWVRSLGCKYYPEMGIATYSSFLAWRIPWTEEPGGLVAKSSM